MPKVNFDSVKYYLLIYIKFIVNEVSVTDMNETNRETIKKKNSISIRESSSSEKYANGFFKIVLLIFVFRAKFVYI